MWKAVCRPCGGDVGDRMDRQTVSKRDAQKKVPRLYAVYGHVAGLAWWRDTALVRGSPMTFRERVI